MVLPNITAPRIEEGKPFDNPEFLTSSLTSRKALLLYNQHYGHYLDKFIKQDHMFADTAQKELPINIAPAAGGLQVASTAKKKTAVTKPNKSSENIYKKMCSTLNAVKIP